MVVRPKYAVIFLCPCYCRRPGGLPGPRRALCRPIVYSFRFRLTTIDRLIARLVLLVLQQAITNFRL